MDNLKVLAGSSLELMEVDDEQNDDLHKETSIEYDMLEIVNAIDTPDFKSIYMNFMPRIKVLQFPKQRDFCFRILHVITKKYEFEFSPIPEITNPLDVMQVYEFVEFLNYDHIEYFGDVWRYLNPNLLKTDVEKFCKRNGDKVIREIEDQIESRDLSELISNFLRTYNKSNMLGWFIGKTIESKILIVLKILEGVNDE